MTYLLATFLGAGGLTAAFRGAVVAVFAVFIGRAVIGPALTTVFDAMARDQAAAAARDEEDE